MSQEDTGVKEIEEVVTPPESPTSDNDKDFYSDIPEPKTEAEDSASLDEVEAGSGEEESETASNKGAKDRIRELNSKAKAEKERAESLARQVEELTAASQMPQFDLGANLPQSESGEITAEELEARILHKAAALSELRLHQQQAAQKVQQEANEVMQDFQELNPDSDEYDSELSEAITEASLAYVRANPGKSLKQYVHKLMKPYKRAIQKEVGDMADTVTRQAAEKALRPTSTPKGGKRTEDLSERELEEKLGLVY